MKKVTLSVVVAAACLVFAGVAAAQMAPSLNEVVMNDTSGDDHEFVEICGEPGTDLTGYTVIVIEGEGTSAGLIDRAFALTGVIGASGFYTLGDAAVNPDQIKGDTIENGANTILLVTNFSGNVGQDLDADNDCVEDGPFPGTIVDGVATAKPSSNDCSYYGVPVLGPDTGDDGTADFDVAGVARCGDCDGDWGMICLNGTEPTDPGCDINNAFNPYVVTYASPGSGNLCSPVSVEDSSWGRIKSDYR
jgi:hypothetical protein